MTGFIVVCCLLIGLLMRGLVTENVLYKILTANQSTNTQPYTSNYLTNVSIAVPSTAVNTDYPIGFSHTTLQLFWLLSDQDITICVNAASGGSPILTINLVAGVRYLWLADGYFTVPFSANVTAFYITNSSGNTANLTGEIMWN